MSESAGYYQDVYRDYDRQNPPYKMAFYRSLVERVVPRSSPARILDIGCAFGRFLSSLNPAWRRCGVDVNALAIETARQAVPDAAFSVSSGTTIPFDGLFDVIVAFDVIEHIASLEEVAAAVRSKLTPTGCFVFVVPVYDGPTGPIITLLDRDPTHVHKQSRRFWLDWTAANFQLVDWSGVLRYLLPWGHYLHAPTKTLRWATPAIAVIARNGAPRQG